MLEKLEDITSKVIDFFGLLIAILLILMIFNVAIDVFARYIFHSSSIGMQEMEWHLFAVIYAIWYWYALKQDAHVRVDFYMILSKKKDIIFWGIFLCTCILVIMVATSCMALFVLGIGKSQVVCQCVGF